MVIDGVEVYHLFDIVKKMRPLEEPWRIESEELETIVRAWCDTHMSTYYAAEPESFSMIDAVLKAKTAGHRSVVVAELIDGVS